MTVSQRVNAERVVLAGWSRAILLQLAHPLVAAGVADHSHVREGGLVAARRLHQTIGAMTRLTFGGPDAYAATIEGIRAIHRRVHGRLRADVGPWAAGTPYSAEDPALVLWVHATLLDSLPLVYGHLVAPLSPDELDAYCREAARVARDLGADTGIPERWADLQGYMRGRYASGELVVSDEARLVAEAVLAPAFGPLVAPARHANRVITTALLPEDLRQAYGLRFTAADARASARWLRVIRAARRAAPRWLREWPAARRQGVR